MHHSSYQKQQLFKEMCIIIVISNEFTNEGLFYGCADQELDNTQSDRDHAMSLLLLSPRDKHHGHILDNIQNSHK